jgi:hypothetical protein
MTTNADAHKNTVTPAATAAFRAVLSVASGWMSSEASSRAVTMDIVASRIRNDKRSFLDNR